MSRGKNNGAAVATASTSPLSGTSRSTNQSTNSSNGANHRSSRLSSNTVHLGFFVVPKAVKRGGDVERSSSPASLNKTSQSVIEKKGRTNDSMKSAASNVTTKSNGRRSSRNSNHQQQQQQSSASIVGVQRAGNSNTDKATSTCTQSTNSNSDGAVRREGKEDYWYYDSVSDGFYYELNGSRGWRKRNPKQHANFVAAQQQARAHVPTAHATTAFNNTINSTATASIQQQQPNLDAKSLLVGDVDKSELKNSSLMNRLNIANNLPSVQNFKYDEHSDGFFYEKASVDGWRRRQPTVNQQLNHAQQQPQPSRLSQPQYPQPQSRVVRQLHNQYQERASPQSIFEVFGRPYSEFLAQKMNPLTHRTRQMSNAELEDFIVSRSSQSHSNENTILKQLGELRLGDGLSKCCCGGVPQTDNTTVTKSASSTTINSSLSSDSPPPHRTSKFLAQIMSNNISGNTKTPWAFGPLENKPNNVSNSKESSNFKDFALLPPTSSLRQNQTTQHQRQRSSQTGSFEEHYEFYADCTDSDKASLGNAPSISSIDDLQHSLPWNAAQGFHRSVRRPQQQQQQRQSDDVLSAFLSMANNDNQKTSQSRLNETSIFNRTLKRPDSLSVSQNVVDWGTSVQRQQHSTPLKLDHFLDNIPALNDESKYMFGVCSPELLDKNGGCKRFENNNGISCDFVSNSPLTTPMAFKENLWKDRQWDGSSNLIDLMNNGVGGNHQFAPYSLLGDGGLDADAVLEQNVRDVAKLWQCTV